MAIICLSRQIVKVRQKSRQLRLLLFILFN
nr:MAG TPA: hypothetical protein [Caudoviricetes sp.]